MSANRKLSLPLQRTHSQHDRAAAHFFGYADIDIGLSPDGSFTAMSAYFQIAHTAIIRTHTAK